MSLFRKPGGHVKKDLGDAIDILSVQGVDTLDMPYVRSWCEKLEITDRLESVLERTV